MAKKKSKQNNQTSFSTQLFEDRELWLVGRRGKITGSRLKDIIIKRGSAKKIGFYELIAERLGVPAEQENPMDRGSRLEKDAVKKLENEVDCKFDTSLVLWQRNDNPSIAISPDGFCGLEVAVEAKCLSSARHIEAFLTQAIPSEYEYQKIQYFAVNESLKTLYFAFYDPRILVKEFFYIKVDREQIQEQIQQCLEYQKQTLDEVDQIVNKLSDF